MSTKRSAIETVFTGTDRLSSVLGKIQDRIQSSFGTLGSRLRGDADAIRKVSTSLFRLGQIGFTAGQNVLNWTQEITGKLDAMSKLSRRVGIGAESFQQIAFAAELSGVSFDEFGGAMKTFALNIGRMKAGKGELVEFLKVVSPSMLKRLQGAGSMEEALDVMVEGLGRLKDPSKAAAIAVAGFGDAGSKMALIAENGFDAYKKTLAEAKDLGIGVSVEDLKISEAYDDEMSKAKAIWSGAESMIGASIARAALPQLLELTAWLKDNRQEFRDTMAAIGQGIVDAVNGIVAAGKWIYDNRDALVDWAKVLGGVYLTSIILPALGSIIGMLKSIATLGAAAARSLAGVSAAGGAAAAAGSGVGGAAAGGAAAAGAGVGKGVRGLMLGLGRVAPWLMVADMLMADPSQVITPEMSTEYKRQQAQFAAEDAEAAALGISLPTLRGRKRGEQLLETAPGLEMMGFRNLADQSRQAGRILVEFNNAPPGMTVREVTAPTNMEVDVKSRRGARTLGTGDGL